MGKRPPSVKEVFDQALEVESASERSAFLDAACAGSVPLRQEVEALLRAFESAGSFLEHRDSKLTTTVVISADASTMIGPYRLLEPIGEGGMGTVYRAEQIRPVKRTVALKVIKPGMDSRQVLSRFETERQALALMDHPNIARVLDAGATDAGHPYFIMELVQGAPITRFCDEHRLTPRQRLELFIPVCQAVQHAHQKGVIHRDLKPSNVLVALYDGQPVPKVIDFGVAKATAPRLDGATSLTEFGAVVGTVEYMSPEQAELNPLDIDTRSDIYSLGVLLYELLTGTTPIQRKPREAATLLEALRIVREQQPPTPSSRLSTTKRLPVIAANRGMEPRKLSELVRGELDWIAMKALEKDRNRRYETASALALDLRRYLNDEPVLACPPSNWYRFRKFVQRNIRALAVAAVLAVMLLAVVGTVAGSLGWVARDRASRQAALERAIAQALGDTGNSYRRGDLADARAALRRAEGLLATGRSQGPLEQRAARWRADLAMVTRLEEIRLERSAVKEGHFDSVGADSAYREQFRRYGLDVEALAPADAARRIQAAPISDRLVWALDDWILSKRAGDKVGKQRLLTVAHQADPDPWRNRFREAYGLGDDKAWAGLAREEGLKSQPPATALLLASVLGQIHEHSLALTVLRQAQERYPADFWLNQDLGYLLMRMGPAQSHEAVGFYRAAVALRPESPGVHVNLGVSLNQLDRVAEAEAEFRTAARLKPDYATAHFDLGNTLQQQHRTPEAEAEFRAAIRLDPAYAEAHANLGRIFRETGRTAEAEAEFRTAIKHKPALATAHTSLGNLLKAQGRTAEAEAEFRTASGLPPAPAPPRPSNAKSSVPKVTLSPEEAKYRAAFRKTPDDATTHFNLGNTLRQQGKLAEAEAEYRAAIQLDPVPPMYRFGLGSILIQNHRLVEAEAVYRELIRLKPESPDGHNSLASALRQQGRMVEAEAELRESLRRKPDYALTHSQLGSLLQAKGYLPEAEAEFRAAQRLDPASGQYHFDLGNLLLQSGRAAAAEAEFREALHLNPKMFGAHLNLGTMFKQQGRTVEAEAEFRELLRLNPNFAMAHSLISSLFRAQGWLTEAEAELREAARLDPAYAQYRIDLAGVLTENGRTAEAEAELRAELRRDPSSTGVQYALISVLTQTSRWDEAVPVFAQLIKIQPDNHFILYQAAVLRLYLGDADGYRQACGELLARFGSNDDPQIAERIAKTLMLRPDASGDFEPAKRLVARSMTGTEKHRFRWYFQMLDGLAGVRSGRYSDAVAGLESLKPKAGRGVLDATAFAILAMAHHHLGHREAARAALGDAQAIVAQRMPNPAQGRPFEFSWHDWLICQLLCREADGLSSRDSATSDRKPGTAGEDEPPR
jgi:serine/threonine protein kinase/Flp pilus assembly protein TadD